MQDLLGLAGRVVIVTGAGRGIGTAIAARFGQVGAAVVLAGRTQETLDAGAAAISAAGGRALALRCDVADAGQVAGMIERVLEAFGVVNVLVNNAGVLGEGRLDRLTEEDWDRLMAVNLRGAMHCTRAVFPHMRERGSGAVVNIASISGQTGGFSANIPYAASKGGLIAMTRATARQMAPWGRANAVAPGQIATEMGTRFPAQVRAVEEQVPLGRLGTPDEVADGALFLASNLASYITGAVLNINGGYLMA